LFSRITARDDDGRIVWRQRVEHGDRVNMTALDQRIPTEPQALACAMIPISMVLRVPHHRAG
jgi:hypothetical protein